MRNYFVSRSMPLPCLALTAMIATLGVLAPKVSQAHFNLQSPPASMSQDFLGLPEKLGPCGDEGGGTPTGTVTAYQAGQTITVTINEIIPHPGWYRFALSVNDRSELPAEPVVTAGATACGSVPIQSPPVFPVLADGVFPHTSSFSSPQTTQLTLPSNINCTHCTLQVIEFMSNHGLNNPGGCFYHHCADISISGATTVIDAGPVTTPDSGVVTTLDSGVVTTPDSGEFRPDAGQTTAHDGGSVSDAGTTEAGGSSPVVPRSGCGCSAQGGGETALGVLIALGALIRFRKSPRLLA